MDLNALYDAADVMRNAIERGEKPKNAYHHWKLTVLAKDSDTIRDHLISNVLRPKMLECMVKGEDKEEKRFRLWNLHTDSTLSSLVLEGNIKASTFFTGFWSNDTKNHNSELWKEAERGLMVEELSKVMEPALVVDVSDKQKSTALVVEVIIPPRTEDVA